MSRKTVILIVLIAIGVLVVGGAIGWFAVAPTVIHHKLENAFEKLESKTGRHVAVQGVSLRSLRSVALSGVTISGANAPENVAVAVDSVGLRLANVPLFGSIRIANVEVGTVQVNLTSDDETNLEALLDKLRGSKDEASDEENKEEKRDAEWKKYVTPLPSVTIDKVSVEMTPIDVAGKIALKGVEMRSFAFTNMAEVDKTRYDLKAVVSATLSDGAETTTYESTVEADLESTKTGTISVTMPKSENGEIPKWLKPGEYTMDMEKIAIELPVTIHLLKPYLARDNHTIFSADELRLQMMSMPPKKVSGVWFKEFELIKPDVHVAFSEETNDLKEFVKTLRSAVSKKEAKAEAPGDDAGTASPKDPRDYYFSQRFFVTDAAVELKDARKYPRGDIKIDNLSLESGFRSIRGVVDLDVSTRISAPFDANVQVNGTFDMKADKLDATIDLKAFNSNESTLAMQKALRDMLSFGSGVKLSDVKQTKLDRLVRAIEFKDASASGTAKIQANTKDKTLAMNADWKASGFAIASPLISSEPLDLGNTGSMVAKVDFADKPSITIDSLELTRELAKITMNGTFAKETVTYQRNTKPPQTDSFDTWNYDFVLKLPQTDAQSVFEAIPHAFRTELDGLRATGKIGFDLSVKGRLDNIDEAQHKFDIMTSPDFAIKSWPTDRDITKLNKGFVFRINDPNALLPHSVTVPPSVYPVTITDTRRIPAEIYTPRMSANEVRSRFPNWVLFEDLNPWLVQLITTTEDGSFFTHEGFSSMQIKAALAKNVKRGEFNRGASTISMQLVKNAFFDRNKTVARKAQEALYTWLMESILRIPKQRIMEIYFNVIEFGPEIYGIEEASKYYFGKRSDALTLNEAAFLIAIIPGPRRGGHYRLSGTVSKNLEKTIDFYIREMYRRKCSPETLSAMRARYAKRNQPMPFEPCCPKQSEIELMQQQPVKFYVPEPQNPQEYAYDPAMYYGDGRPRLPVHRSCGYNADAAIEALDSIFEEYSE